MAGDGDIEGYLEELKSVTNVRFDRLRTICTEVFGEPRVRGSHHFFKTPWMGTPLVNIQEQKGGKAAPYQVRQVRQALKKFIEDGHG